ncbi:hypothetical protein [Intrasporangium mesophilum]
MPFYTKSEIRGRGLTASAGPRSASESLRKSADGRQPGQRYDIFLSHSSRDAELILGVKLLLEEQGQSVYVDWVDDPQLSRAHVTAATAVVLRNRMRSCESLIYATSEAASNSRWMPWELGFFDGYRQSSIAILPILDTPNEAFRGLEYLGLYPVIERLATKGGHRRPFVTRRPSSGLEYKSLEGLVKGSDFTRATA